MIRKILAGLALSVGLAAAPASWAQDHITVAPISPSPVAWAYYFIAEPLGYYDEENLDVEVIATPARGSQVPGLLSGQLDFASVPSGTNIPQGDVRGKVKWFLTHERFPWAIHVLADSNVQSLADLKGATIGMRSSNDEPAVKLLMSGGGLSEGDYQMVVTGPGAPAGLAMQNDQVQAVIATAVDAMEIAAAVGDTRALDLGGAEGLYNGGLMASTELLENNPDLAVRFGRALAKAIVYVDENPKASLEILGEMLPEAVQDPETSLRIREALNELNRPQIEARFFGDPALYQKQIDMLQEIGVLEAGIKAEEVVNNDLLDQIWDFDVDAIREAARAGAR